MLVIAPVELRVASIISAILGMVSRDLRPCPLDLSNRNSQGSQGRVLATSLYNFPGIRIVGIPGASGWLRWNSWHS